MAEFVRVDGTGVEVPSLDEALINMLATMQAVFGEDLSLAPQTVQAQIAGLLAVVGIEYAEPLAALTQAVNRHTATGTQLDALFSRTGAERRPATRSLVEVTVTGTSGTNVPAGTRFGSGSDEWVTISPVTLASAGVAVTAQAVEAGAIRAAAGEVTRIVTPVAGLETVTNSAAAVPGRAMESDAEYRQSGPARAARTATGPLAAVRAALIEALADRLHVTENRSSSAAATRRQFTLQPSALLAIVEGGLDSDIMRAVETHRGMGAPTMTAIYGDTPAADSVFNAITAGTVEWNGTDYTGLDLSGDSDGTARAATLTTLLAATGVHVAFVDGIYVAQFAWLPDAANAFGDNSVTQAFGFDPDNATATPGPFVRPRRRPLAVAVTGVRSTGFPADGLDQVRTNLVAVADGYDLGATPYLNDFLAAAQIIAGLQVSAITVQYDSADVSGIAPPLDTLWSLPAAGINLSGIT